ncbi:FtsX-like permease family protein [compost metagenome]
MIKLKDPSKVSTFENKYHQLFYVNRVLRWAKEEGLTPEEYIKKNGDIKPITSQLKTARLHAAGHGFPEGKGNYQFLLIMSGLSILILVLSIVNYVNLATANAIKRAKEVGVRKVLGASKKNIVKQFLFETIISALFSILLALVIVELALPYYNDFLGKTLVISSSEFYLQLILIFIVVVITAGIFPAIYVANFEALNVLKGNFNRSKKGIWLRNGMLILQFGIASFFIIGSYIVYEQVQYMSTKDLGFKGEQIMDIRYRKDNSIENPKEIFSRYNTIKQELKKIKGVEAVSSGAFSLGNNSGSSSSFTYNDVSVQG